MFKKISLALGFAMLLSACVNTKIQEPGIAHENAEKLDNQTCEQKFVGILPCADCDGIKYEINLNNGHYEINETYLGKNMDSLKSEGEYSVSDDKVFFIGSDKPKFKFNGDNLQILDQDSNEANGSLADKYILKPVN